MSAQPQADVEQQLVNDIYDLASDPLGFVNYAFEWGEGDLKESPGPRKWQAQILSDIKEHLESDKRFTPCQLAVASGHGIGKSALVSFIINWALSTCEDCKVTTTANTGDQLATKTVPEVSKWFKKAINSHWWTVRAEAIKAKDPKKFDTWRADFLTWSLDRTEAFAGLHNVGKRILLIFDEASAIPDKIWEVAEGALTDADTEIIWLAFGNPTQNTGRFRECFGKYKHRWKTYQIDSRTVEGTNKDQINKWVEDYGEDSDFVRVRVRGEFPRAGSNQFISSEVVALARRNKAVAYETLPLVGSCDVARFGDDQTVIGWRQGRKSDIWKRLRGLSVTEVADRCIEFIDQRRPEGFIIDADGIGAGVYDYLKSRNYDRKTCLVEFHGGAKAFDENMYFNKRAEVWGLMRNWLENADIPDDPELETDLTGVQYGFSTKQQIQLEKKEDMKKRGLSSPDAGDMLAMTFAVNIVANKPPASYEPPMRMGVWT